MRKIRYAFSLLIILSILLNILLGVNAHAEKVYGSATYIAVDDNEEKLVKELDASYDDNSYLSLFDMAVLLKGSSKEFNLETDGDSINIVRNKEYESDRNSNEDWGTDEIPQNASFSNSQIKIDGEESRFYSMKIDYKDGKDYYISLADFCMIFDLGIEVLSDHKYRLNTQSELLVDPATLEKYGYFEGVHAVLVGDVSTNDIYYEYKAAESFPIASTTKLMTVTLVLDALQSGKIHLEDKVTISEAAQKLAEGADGVIALKAGKTLSLKELIYGMLLRSSNECALTLAEYVGGDEEGFVSMMNDKAKELGMELAFFYNPHGLPVFTEKTVVSKVQNRMSAQDMFKLCSYLINTHPEIFEITSCKEYTIEGLDNLEIKNSNPLLYNKENVTGLKTGTTNKAGACLVSSVRANKNGKDHDLLVVMFGAETSQDRGRVSELMCYYAEDALMGKVDTYVTKVAEENTEGMPVSCDGIISYVVDSVR